MIAAEAGLHATLRRHAPGKGAGEALLLSPEEGGRLSDLLMRLGLSEEELKTACVNNCRQGADYRLRDSDRVASLLPVAGG